MKINNQKILSKLRSTGVPALMLSLFLCFGAGTAAAQCWTSDLSEEEQLAITRETFEAELYSESSEAAKCYLEDFPQGSGREEMLFLRAESFRKGGDLKRAAEVYEELQNNFPKSKAYLDNAMLQEGISLAKRKQYSAAVKSLNLMINDYPKSPHRNEALFWLGYVSSYRAESLRKNDNERALLDYQASVQHFRNANPEFLTSKQQQERWYLLGRAWWFLDNVTKASQAWNEYINLSDSITPQHALNLKFQLATGFQQTKDYENAENWFARIVKEHPDSKLATESAFLRAEMAYAGSILKTHTAALDSQLKNRLVKYYKLYLDRKNKKHRALSYYRIGILLQDHRPQDTISAFQNYLNTKDKTYAAEVHYRLGFLFIEAKQQKNAIQIFEKYLKTKDKTYAAEIHYRLGYLLIETKQQKKAIQIFEKYLNSKDKTYAAEVHYQLGFLYIESKQQKKAIQIFEKYLSGKDERYTAEIQIRLGYLYIETKQQKKAIKIFEKYLASGAIKNTAETQLSLGYLYVEAKKPFLAISALEQVRMHPDHQRNYELLKTLMLLYRENVSEEKYEQFLLKVNSDQKLTEKVRHEFQTQLVLEYFEHKKCDKLISELNIKPGYLQKSKKTNPEEWQHLLYMRGSCLLETRKWDEARLDLRQIRNTEKYRQQAIQMLLEAHRQLEDWKSITWEFQEVYDRKSPALTKTDFQLWVFAAQRRDDFQRLGRLKIIYERWKQAYPEDSQNLAEINKYITGMRLQELTAQENWKAVSAHIRKQVQTGFISLDEQHFSQLLFAENKLANWAGVLSAYVLLSKHDRKRAETLDALISRAKVAEKLENKELSIKFYQQALKVKPLNQDDKKKQAEIKNFLAQRSFQQWIKKGEWAKVSKTIRQEVAANQRKLDDANFELLLYAENQKSGSKKYNGILDAYALLATFHKNKTVTVKALIDQGYAAEKLGGFRRAKGYYRKALIKTPDKNIKLVLQLTGELKRLYERSKDYKSLVRTYKRAYSALKKSSLPKKEYRTYAYLIGYHQSTHLKQNNKARIWLMRSDGGGSTSQELQAVFWVAKLDREANKPEMAIKRLKELAGRKIPKNSSLYVQIHFELGTLYHFKEKWKSALRHYVLASKARAPKSLKQFQKAAKEKAQEIDNYLKSIQASKG
ncbi:MAG: tetratricopeptide repeat protein [SAR324 cluster bacterium]|nr:tetratricopeptide repeat protein [SAR324 cluster bacterium]